jgi:hypothetical protein
VLYADQASLAPAMTPDASVATVLLQMASATDAGSISALK